MSAGGPCRADPLWGLPCPAVPVALTGRRCPHPLCLLPHSPPHKKDVVLNLLFAGHDTSASTLTYGMWLLAEHHPGVLGRLREEQAGVVQAHGADITPEALKHMPCVAGQGP